MTDADRSAVFEKIQAIIVEHLGVDAELVTEQATFEALGADSLDTVELVMAVEEAFGIEVPEADAENMTTVKDIVDFVAKKTPA